MAESHICRECGREFKTWEGAIAHAAAAHTAEEGLPFNQAETQEKRQKVDALLSDITYQASRILEHEFVADRRLAVLDIEESVTEIRKILFPNGEI
jgi:predicted ATP-dependent serine protease